MQFVFTEEQEQFRDALRRFLQDHSPPAEVRRCMETAQGFDPQVWRRLADELALPGLHVTELHGGAGFGAVELGIAMEEMGRTLLCAPYFSCVLATQAIRNAASESWQRELLPPIARGERLAALAVTEASGRWDADGIDTVAYRCNGNYRLDGAKKFVVDGQLAEQLIVVARDAAKGDGLSWFVVDPQAAGVTRQPLETMDLTRKQAAIAFAAAPAELLGEAGNGEAALTRTLDQACVALAHEMVGGAQVLLDSAVEYAKMRMQFGRPIGSFQAIKHRCADMLLDVELARSAAYYAAWAEADAAPDRAAHASLAKASASDAYLRTAASCIQIHGGTGFTWDHDTHLWFKRAKSSEVMLGDPNEHRERMLQRWED